MDREKINAQTIGRAIALAVMLANSVLIMFGCAPLDLDENTIYELCSIIGLIIVTIVGWWKDNDWTKKARARKATAKAIANGEVIIVEPKDIAEADDVEPTKVEELETEYEKEAK